MGPEFKPIAGAQGWQVSNPSVLSMAPLLASLAIIQRAGMWPHQPGENHPLNFPGQIGAASPGGEKELR